MATFHDAKSGTDNSSGTSTATADTLAVTAGDLIVAICKWEGALAGSTASVSDGTDTYSAVSTVQGHTNNDLNLHLFWTTATTTGTRTITSTLTAARSFRRLGAISITPAGGSTWTLGNTGQGTNGNSSSTPTAGSVTGVSTGVAIMGAGLYGDRDFTAGTGWTVPTEFATANMVVAEYDLTPSGTVTGDGTFSAGVEWLAHVAIFQENASASAVKRMSLLGVG